MQHAAKDSIFSSSILAGTPFFSVSSSSNLFDQYKADAMCKTRLARFFTFLRSVSALLSAAVAAKSVRLRLAVSNPFSWAACMATIRNWLLFEPVLPVFRSVELCSASGRA